MRSIALLALGGLLAVRSIAQIDSSANPWTISGYLETYYGYDFAQPGDHLRPGFVYSHNRTNEFNLNLGFLKAGYLGVNTRGNIAIATGTYMNANYVAEPGVLRNIFEANAGVKLSKNRELWVDAGIFASHIGFESAIGKDCWSLTRSMVADNSPYFESGVKISYTSPNQQWFFVGLALNGWQRIQRVDGNNRLGLGYQVQYKPSAKVTLNSSAFVGSDKPDSTEQTRLYHNFFGQFQVSDRFGLILGFDLGTERKPVGEEGWNTWCTPVAIARLKVGESNYVAGRLEYYTDPGGVIIVAAVPDGFRSWGYSINYDYQITPQMVWRVELKQYSSPDSIYRDRDGAPAATNTLLSTVFALSF